MPPVLALLLCTVFVIYLLRVEHKESGTVSYGALIPTVWIISTAIKPFSSWFAPPGSLADFDVEAGSPLDRNLLLVLLFAGLVTLGRRRVDWGNFKRDNRWLYLIAVYALISITWSEFTFVSIKRYIRFLGTPIMALIVLTEANPRQALQSILRKLAYLSMPFSLVLIKYYPSLGVSFAQWSGQQMWVGVASQKNSFGMVCYVSAFFLCWELLRIYSERKLHEKKDLFRANLITALIAAILLKGPGGAYSATSITALLLGLGTLFALLQLHKRGQVAGLSVMMSAIVVLFAYGFGAPFGARTIAAPVLELMGRDASFTDRDQIWHELATISGKNPILGLGYGGFWVRKIETDVNCAHNGQLGIILELGIVGVLLVFGYVVSMCRSAHRLLRSDFWWGALCFCYLLMIVLHNITEASFLSNKDLLWTLLVFLQVTLIVHTQFKRTALTSVADLTEPSDEKRPTLQPA